jgi:thiazole/oxazole-forming peptide maturase SagD family component
MNLQEIDKNIDFWDDFLPIAAVPTVQIDSHIRFLSYNKQIDLGAEYTNEVWSVLSQCNGYRNINEIASISKICPSTVKQVLMDLINLNIIYDSREMYGYFHKISSNPLAYYRNLSNENIVQHQKCRRDTSKRGNVVKYVSDSNSLINKISSLRYSCRNFSEEQIHIDLIGSLCENAYSSSLRPVASGGSLYPLKLYLVVTKDQIGLKRGYYEYNFESNNLVQYVTEPDIEQLKYCYNDEILAFGSSIQIVIAGDLTRQPYKYSNRGYRFTLIEAGQVAQNISLYCTEKGLGSCELGGFLDEPLMEELKLQDISIFPLLIIAVGKPSTSTNTNHSEIYDITKTQLFEKTKYVKSFGVNVFDAGDASFFGAYATYNEQRDFEIAGATARSYFRAVSKAMFEAYERSCCSKVKSEKSFCIKDIHENYLDPREYVPLTVTQSNNSGLQHFTEDTVLDWVGGLNYKNEKVYVPIDMVYYGTDFPYVPIFNANSSGVAAQENYEKAATSALLELIERDAVMSNWFYQKPPMVIQHKLLPIHVINRSNYWMSKGRELFVLDMCSLYAPTIEVVIISDEYPCFVCGSACNNTSSETAILKALDEAEYKLLLALKFPRYEIPQKDNVITPDDHAKYYYDKSNMKKIKWLWNGEMTYQMPVSKYTEIELMSILKATIVDLSQVDSDITVVRALSPKLVPISFGFGLDCYTHPTINIHDLKSQSRDIPHYFD